MGQVTAKKIVQQMLKSSYSRPEVTKSTYVASYIHDPVKVEVFLRSPIEDLSCRVCFSTVGGWGWGDHQPQRLPETPSAKLTGMHTHNLPKCDLFHMRR